MGACLDLIRNAARTLEIEANAVSDNPLLFPESGDSLSGGNFHAQPVAFAADTLAVALCEIGSISERRTAVLVDPKMSGLPPFLPAVRPPPPPPIRSPSLCARSAPSRSGAPPFSSIPR